MEIKELFNYFLEKEGYLFKNDDKRDKLFFEVSKDLFNSRTKKGKIQNDYSFLEFLESSHGMHTSSTAVANGDFKGIAPKSQLAFLKVGKDSSEEELSENPRAHSAKLRILKRIK